MKLEDNEFTTKTFLEHLKKKFKTKTNGEEFTTNDVAQYLRRGYTPYRYGNIQITSEVQGGIRIISITKPEVEKPKKKK